ncbi:hypothetical protein DSAG12_01244 [Promethearchaeum syntrophicum]|uniref:Uncharacterized protein n=1 Tax=Promethearchaeum syntrophicum TaxID=2594042 RepID=A0A5B9D8D1_9ARCH|nr:hypothetical protein [Candidatus Prometheoarchaeum syntrophicum]QEE15419.1 hypothetical protein DSAG12_01244 [Candidatus Prometheoarchaeum syntrophicum]
MKDDEIELKMTAHVGILRLLIPQKFSTLPWSQELYAGEMGFSTQWMMKFGFALPKQSPTIHEQVISSKINHEIKVRWAEDTMVGTIQTVTMAQRMFKGFAGSETFIDILENFFKKSQIGKMEQFLTRHSRFDKVLKTLEVLKKASDLFEGDFIEDIVKEMFYISHLRKYKFQNKNAEIWFKDNWRLLVTDESIRNSFISLVYNSLEIWEKENHNTIYGFFRQGGGRRSLTKNSFIYTFSTNMRKIQDIINIQGNRPLAFPIINYQQYNAKGEYTGYTGNDYKAKYRHILNAYALSMLGSSSRTSQWHSNEFEVMSNERLTDIMRSDDSEKEFKMYEVLMMESLTRFLVNTFFGGDISNFNNFNYKVANTGDPLHPENDIISPPIYNPDHNNADFRELSWLSDHLRKDSRIYIGPRVIDLKQTGTRIDELGMLIPYDIVKDSFSESAIVFGNNAYKDENGNWVFVNNDLRSDSVVLLSLQKMGTTALKYFEREAAEWDGKNTKKMAGDFIRFLGQMYGTDCLKSVYIENAGMTTASYLKYKPFDIIGLRAKIHAPTVCIVPNAKMTPKVKAAIKNEIVNRNLPSNTRGYALAQIFEYDGSGLDSIVTIADYYRKIISHGNPGDFDGDGNVDGQFSVIMDHDERILFDRARLMAAEQGLKFDGSDRDLVGLKGFINYIRQIDFTVSDFTGRLGLVESQAKIIVEAYGLDWADGETGNAIWDKSVVDSWYTDLDHSTTYYEGGNPSSHWSHFAFKMFYEHMASTSGQIHLLFNPVQWANWLEKYKIDHPNANIPEQPFFYASDTTWTDPQSWNPEISYSEFPVMSYFNMQFMDIVNDRITLHRFVSNSPHVDDLMSLLLYLYNLQWRPDDWI